MSIEKTISDLTAAVNVLTAALNQRAGGAGAPIVQQATGAVTGGTALGTMPAAQAQMPTLPTFAAAPAPAPAAAVQGAPFTDRAGLIAYVMAAYMKMSPTKGALIQGVLTQMGYQIINDVKPEHYGSLFQGVEALKRS